MTLPPGCHSAEGVGGGYINEAFRAVLADGSEAFVKTRPGAEPGEYAAEAAGLAWLAAAGGLRTPRVLDVGSDYLALEWVDEGAIDGAGAEELGRGLAITHRAGAESFGDAPYEGPCRLGEVALANEAGGDWPEFYAEQRLLPLVRMARERGAIDADGAAAVERVADRMADLVGPSEPPSRLHGDLWSGNVLADTDGRPWLIDPAAYGGHREVDLAMLTLFGPPHAAVLGAYQEAYPCAAGWQQRVELYQLLPLLVHAVLFGGSYGDAVRRAARRYL